MVFGLSFVWPQIFRIARVRSVEGISPRGQLHAISGGCFWIVYGYARVNVPMMITNTVILSATVFIAVLLIKHRKMPAWHLIGVLAVFLTVAVVTTLVNPSITAWVGIVIGTTSIIPQTTYVLRYADLSGVSSGMYSLMTLNCASWLLYGFVIGDVLLAGPNFIFVPCATLITIKALRYQRRAARSALTTEAELASA